MSENVKTPTILEKLKNVGYTDEEIQSVIMEDIELRRDARKSFRKSLYIKQLKDQCVKGTADVITQELYDATFSPVKDIAKSLGFFLTITPPPIILLKEFVKMIDDFHHKKWLKNYCYVYEQRGKDVDTCGEGFHCHTIILRDGKKYSEMMREIESTLGRLGNVKLHSYFKIRSIPDLNDLQKTLKYILVSKVEDGTGKDLKAKYDIPFREHNGLLNYYSKGEDIQTYIKKVL